MAISGPDGVDAAVTAGVDLDGSPIPLAMLALYKELMELEAGPASSGVRNPCATGSCAPGASTWTVKPRQVTAKTGPRFASINCYPIRRPPGKT